MTDIDFHQIAPRLGDQREAFEALCCQIARRVNDSNKSFTRLHGAGGDGGIECYLDLENGQRVGWQAKYVFDIGKLITQATKSLETALKIHPTLGHFIVCFPFDLTGKTGRKGKSSSEKFNDWKKAQEKSARASGRTIQIEAWAADRLIAELVNTDVSGGIRSYFFDKSILTHTSFNQHIERAFQTAGPRYSPELSVDTPLSHWMSALGRTDDWEHEFGDRIKNCLIQTDDLIDHLSSTGHQFTGNADEKPHEESWMAALATLQNELNRIKSAPNGATTDVANRLVECLNRAVDLLNEHDTVLVTRLTEQHGKNVDTKGFRQFMAEYQCTFPLATVDKIREVVLAASNLSDWLESAAGLFGFSKTALIVGDAGSGKTHGVCESACKRFKEGLLSCMLFGHEFNGEPEPLARIRELLKLPGTLSGDAVLDALDSAAEASGSILILFIDALNETKPMGYWEQRIAALASDIATRKHLRLCVTCRSGFVNQCIPEAHGFACADHKGFEGGEQAATQAFFNHFGLEPPVTPMLPPEFSNPLYLRLVCKTLQSLGLRALPYGWHGLTTAMKAFIGEMDKQWAREHNLSAGAATVIRSLTAVANGLIAGNNTLLTWSQAEQLIAAQITQCNAGDLLQWLIRSDLLIEDAPRTDSALGTQSTVRLAFERLGDYVIACEMIDALQDKSLRDVLHQEGDLGWLFKNLDAIEANGGIISMLSMLIPENIAVGSELQDHLSSKFSISEVTKLTLRAFPLRDPSSFSASSGALVWQGFALPDFGYETMDIALRVSTLPSDIDAFWLDSLLKSQPLAERDAYWCGMLHDGYQHQRAVRRLIEHSCSLDFDQLEPDIAERWIVVLLWFTTAADRRVADHATRAASKLFAAHTDLIPRVLERMNTVDDDALRERTLLAVYGALLLSRCQDICEQVAQYLINDIATVNNDRYHNALIRDHVRCLVELAVRLGSTFPIEPTKIFDKNQSEWPLQLPNDDSVESWKSLPRLVRSCTDDDFFIYSLGCLSPWQDNFEKMDFGRWILGHVADEMDYASSDCNIYDNCMLGEHGGGRSRVNWAERIGKKYQWIALFRLASRLSDHVERKEDSWDPEPQREPMVLLEERKIDPTLSRTHIEGDADFSYPRWYVDVQKQLETDSGLSDEEWIANDKNLPNLETILVGEEVEQKNWMILDAHTSWDDKPQEAAYNEKYRRSYVSIRGYLVPSKDFKKAYASIEGRNFFGRWMPEGPSWLYGFIGEWPWATPYNIEPDSWHGSGRGHEDLPTEFIPTCARISGEWEYDATIQGSRPLYLPGRHFFEFNNFRFDSNRGFKNKNGTRVFRDYSDDERLHESL